MNPHSKGFIYLLAPLALLAGCATTTVTEFRGPNGDFLKSVKCVSDPNKCLIEASKACSKDGSYRVLSSESHAGGLVADLLPGPATWYGMTFSCGASDGQMPDFKFKGQSHMRPSTTTCSSMGSSVVCNTF